MTDTMSCVEGNRRAHVDRICNGENDRAVHFLGPETVSRCCEEQGII